MIATIWEGLDQYTDRLKVPGGWIVRSSFVNNNGKGAIHQIFIADAMHEWALDVKERRKGIGYTDLTTGESGTLDYATPDKNVVGPSR